MVDDTSTKRIAVTMGDPAGVGPELCLAALRAFSATPLAPLVLGDRQVLARVAQRLGIDMDGFPSQTAAEFLSSNRPLDTAIVHIDAADGKAVAPGVVSADTGRAAYAYLEQAIDWALNGTIAAIATAPLHKGALAAAGHDYPGHTEILAARTAAPRHCMMLTAPEITCSLVTTHIGLRHVAAELSLETIRDVIELTHQAMGRLCGRPPRLRVCGLNPHAGENGLFGGEERELIEPAIHWAREKGMDIDGPLSADTAFLPAIRRQTDAYICMYHDQGLIPLKTLAFDEAVNVTLGLPIVRTSVDHGTALDIAWTGKAQHTSMLRAIELAARLATPGP